MIGLFWALGLLFWIPEGKELSEKGNSCSFFRVQPRGSWIITNIYQHPGSLRILSRDETGPSPIWLKMRRNPKFKIPLWNYNSITIIQQHLNTYAINLQTADL